MEIYNLFVQPFLLGMSSGLFCVTYCLPFVASYMVLEEREKREDFKVILKIISGRLLGYICFGAFFGFLGERINNFVIDLILTISMMLLGLILTFYALGLIRNKGRFCPGPKIKNKTPLAMGFLMGVKVCPPILMALAYIFTLHNWFRGIIFFSIFFLGTTVYFLPLTFLGFLNKMREFQWAGRISALIVGISFFVYNFYSLLKML